MQSGWEDSFVDYKGEVHWLVLSSQQFLKYRKLF